MTTKVEKDIVVDVPIRTVYDQWTQFEDFPQFMGGVERVTQLSDDRLRWVAEIAGVRREWEAQIFEQIPEKKVSWAAMSGATNAGMVTFNDLGDGRTAVHLTLEYEPEGLVEKVGDALHFIDRQAQSDLERFKEFIESEGYATGAWRGSINEGQDLGPTTLADAATSRGDSGKPSDDEPFGAAQVPPLPGIDVRSSDVDRTDYDPDDYRRTDVGTGYPTPAAGSTTPGAGPITGGLAGSPVPPGLTDADIRDEPPVDVRDPARERARAGRRDQGEDDPSI